MKGISRIDSRNTHCWFVRIYRDGKVHSKTFSDGVYGSQEKALKAAKEYKEEYDRQNPPSYEYKRLRTKPPQNNKSGIVGVSETYGRAQGNRGAKMPCFSVTWVPTPNRPRCKKFYFSKYGGREAAFEAAKEFRKARELEILQDLNRDSEPKKEEMDPTHQMLSNLKSRPFR